MRHACAVHMLKNGAGIRDIQVLLGYKPLKSTQVYTTLTAKDLKNVIDKFHPREKMGISDDKIDKESAAK